MVDRRACGAAQKMAGRCHLNRKKAGEKLYLPGFFTGCTPIVLKLRARRAS